MCGIVGRIGGTGMADIGKSLPLLHHRGPDDRGTLAMGGALLGHTRLSIQDLSDCGHQPMTDDDKALSLVFNGEIYNFKELRRELESAGHSFRSTGDTEVLLRAYEEWGQECVHHLNGMWSFALWDAEKQRLFCSRDRFGVKPFYYAHTPRGFLFASEIKVLLALDPALRSPDWGVMARFLSVGMLDESERTFFEQVKQLAPGCNLVLDAGGMPEVHRYYDVFSRVAEMDPSSSELSQAPSLFRQLFTDAVALRLRSDVPVGTCLSGGLDSSAIVGVMSSLTTEPVRTFTSIYPGTDSDESVYASLVARRFDAIAETVEPRKEDFFDVLPKITWYQDEPTAAPGLYSQWHVMKLAQGKVKVLLDGQGGDEVLGGYVGYYSDYFLQLLSDAGHGRNDGRHRLRQEYREIAAAAGGWRVLARGMVPRHIQPLGRTLARSLPPGRPLDAGFYRDFARPYAPPADSIQLRDRLNQHLAASLARRTLPALLHYEDRNSMAFSIEARTPFLDYRLVEFALALPSQLKMRGWETKLPLRRGLADLLPEQVLQRRDKKGFPTPLGSWLRQGLMPGVRELLLSERTRARRLLDPKKLTDMLDSHEQGRADHHWVIWRLVTQEIWFRTFIDSDGKTPVTL